MHCPASQAPLAGPIGLQRLFSIFSQFTVGETGHERHQPCSEENSCGFVSSTLLPRVTPLPAQPLRHPVPKPRCFPLHRCVQP